MTWNPPTAEIASSVHHKPYTAKNHTPCTTFLGLNFSQLVYWVKYCKTTATALFKDICLRNDLLCVEWGTLTHPFKVIQGHRFWYQSKPICNFLLVIQNYILSCTVPMSHENCSRIFTLSCWHTDRQTGTIVKVIFKLSLYLSLVFCCFQQVSDIFSFANILLSCLRLDLSEIRSYSLSLPWYHAITPS